jgi:transposase-like protein
MAFGDHVMISAVAVDVEGNKHVLAIREGATENATVAKELLEDLEVRGLNTDQKRLFVIDGSNALRAGRSTPSLALISRCSDAELTNSAT